MPQKNTLTEAGYAQRLSGETTSKPKGILPVPLVRATPRRLDTHKALLKKTSVRAKA